ncbi:restriction endonuclease subunit S [Micromonospora zamorensis]|uniref:restriction endonuclease subunit S n=1 Tax=Micromonospora zamorensis TaxID=709883 RepID=UPI0033C29BF2
MNHFTDLPTHWESSRIDWVATVNARIGWKALTAAEYQHEGYAFLATPNIKNSEIDFENVNFVSEFRYRESPELQLTKGDVLLTKDGFTLGTVNVVRNLPRPATVNGSIAVLRPFGIHPGFLRYVIASAITQAHIQAVKDGMDVLHLFQRDIKKLPVPLPPYQEQRRIADFLDTETARIDQLLSGRQRQVALLHERRTSVLTECVTYNEADAHVHELVGKIRADWPVLPLRRILPGINVGVVINPSTHFTKEGIPFIHGFNVRSGYIERNGMKYMSPESNSLLGRSRVRVGDTLVVRAGSPGRAAVVTREYDGANCASVLILRRSERVIPEFLAAFLNSPAGQGQVRFSQYGAAQEVISASQALAFVMPLPDTETQQSRVKSLNESVAEIQRMGQKLEQQLHLLAERRSALITAAVTGQVDVSTASGRGIED